MNNTKDVIKYLVSLSIAGYVGGMAFESVKGNLEKQEHAVLCKFSNILHAHHATDSDAVDIPDAMVAPDDDTSADDEE